MKKKFYIVFIFFIIIFIALEIFSIIFINKVDSQISLKNDEIIIEYGNTYNPNIQDLIDINSIKFIDVGRIRIVSNIENEPGKNYSATGEYNVKVYYKDKVFIQDVKVVDTIAPIISIRDSIEIPIDTDLSTYNFDELINVSDLSKVNDYKINLDNVNSAISGEYVAKVTVEDIYLNKAEKEFKIIIPEKKEEINTEILSKPEINTKPVIKEEKNNNTNNSNINISDNAKLDIKEDTKVDIQQEDEYIEETFEEKNEKIKTDEKETKEETIQEEKIDRCTNNNNHAIAVGNSNKWFNSKEEAIKLFDAEIKKWGKLWTSNQIQDEEYYLKCPYGYEIYTCPFCEKWTINFYYN